jgi:hypothetical protein
MCRAGANEHGALEKSTDCQAAEHCEARFTAPFRCANWIGKHENGGVSRGCEISSAADAGIRS